MINKFKKFKLSIFISIISIILILLWTFYDYNTSSDAFGLRNLAFVIPFIAIPFSLILIWQITFFIKYIKEKNKDYLSLSLLFLIPIIYSLFIIIKIIFS